MNIKELAIDLLMKTHLFEQSFYKAEAINKISDLQFQIAEHIVKIFMYTESQFINHWYNELNSWFIKVQRCKIKVSKKPLSYEILRKILWEQPLESIEEVQSMMNEISYDYSTIKIDEPDARIVHKHAEDTLSKVCMDISKNKFRDIRNYLHVSP